MSLTIYFLKMTEIRNRIDNKNTAILINESEISYGLSTTTNSLL